MYRLAFITALTGTLLLVGGCGQEPSCLQGIFAGINLRVTSAATGAALLDARGEVIDGAYRDSLLHIGDGIYEAAPNRRGTYAVHLEHAGFASWDTSGVTVLGSGPPCPLVTTEHAEVRLAPSP